MPLVVSERNREFFSILNIILAQISSDMVVVCGKYTILTLCIYGYVAPPPSLEAQFRSPSPTRRYLRKYLNVYN